VRESRKEEKEENKQTNKWTRDPKCGGVGGFYVK